MSFTLDQVVPWGRTFDEYVAMFALQESDLDRPILGCGDGPAAFNAELTRRGGRVVSVDPLYRFSCEQIRERVNAVYQPMLAETERNKHEFVWQHVKSTEELGRLRMSAMNDFLKDYDAGVKDHRYIAGELPSLPFDDAAFALVLCSHFLFLYSEHHDLEFHVASIKELCRVAEEVRIFPLNELGARQSRHLNKCIEFCERAGLTPEIVSVDYEFQKNANRFLRLGRRARVKR